MKIYTIGHSNRSLEEFIRLLQKYEIEVLADVRRFPTSKFEHFRAENLKEYLEDVGIKYIWFEKLGGYRKRIFDVSPNTAIKSEGFRNYADYMLTEEFRREVSKLVSVARERRTAVMCAERLYWKCHRKFIADYLTFLGFEVFHIMDDGTKLHKLSREARITDSGLIYCLTGD